MVGWSAAGLAGWLTEVAAEVAVGGPPAADAWLADGAGAPRRCCCCCCCCLGAPSGCVVWCGVVLCSVHWLDLLDLLDLLLLELAVSCSSWKMTSFRLPRPFIQDFRECSRRVRWVAEIACRTGPKKGVRWPRKQKLTMERARIRRVSNLASKKKRCTLRQLLFA